MNKFSGQPNLAFALISLFLGAVIFFGCAKEMAPTGGPKDTTPPQLRKANPANYSTNISPKKIVLTFDEFIELRNAQQRVIISPPLNEPLKISLKGKSIVVEIKDSLRPNTTYNINFSDVIRDFTEGNINNDFQYIFSTDSVIDTVFVSGTVFDAFSGKPVENVQVGLYADLSDSAVARKKPDYFARTNKEGKFVIRNVKSNDYRIFALQDIDNNMLYNLPNEAVAFLTDTLYPAISRKIVSDTVHLTYIDTLAGDTVHRDSVISKELITSTTDDIKLRLFLPLYQKQFVKKVVRPRRNMVVVNFNRPTATDVLLTDMDGNPFLKSPLSLPDSVLFFVPDQTAADKDTLQLLLSYSDIDSLKNSLVRTDTLTAEIERNNVFAEDTSLIIKTNIENKTLDINQKLTLFFNNPITQYDFDKISFFIREDSLLKKISTQFVVDSSMFFMFLETKLPTDQNFRLTLDSAAFIDIYGNISSSQPFDFKVPSEAAYGVLAITLLFDYSEETVFELTDKDGKNTFWSGKPGAEKNLTIRNLKPGTYGLRMYRDINSNNRQDTGDYYLRIQPEHTIRYDRDITIRANWDTEITWEINP